MLILLATWIAYNWWRLLIGVVAIIIIIEYRYYRKKEPDSIRPGDKGPDRAGSCGQEPNSEEPGGV